MPPTTPAAITIVFDGLCHLCSGSVAFLARRLDGARFVPVQSEEGAARMKDAGLDALDPESFLVITNDGTPVQKSQAVIAALKAAGGGWKVVAVVLRLLPRPAADRLYRFVAARRYRWFGRRQTCYVPRS